MIACAPPRIRKKPRSKPLDSATRQRIEALLALKIEFIPNARFADYEADETLTPEVAKLLTESRVASTGKKRLIGDFGSPLSVACETPLLSATEERHLFERMNHLKFRAVHLREWLSTEPPSETALHEIEHVLQEAEVIRNRIVSANVRLVISIVKTYSDVQNPFDDLVSEGLLSMMHAIEKFDYDRGFRFSTYATRAIRRNLYRLLVQRQKDRTRYANMTQESSLEIPDERHHSAISEHRWTELQGQLKRMLQQLDPRERLIVRARFGMDKSGRVQTLQALAKSLGVCKERVRQLEQRAIDKLQKMVQEVKMEEPAS